MSMDYDSLNEINSTRPVATQFVATAFIGPAFAVSTHAPVNESSLQFAYNPRRPPDRAVSSAESDVVAQLSCGQR